MVGLSTDMVKLCWGGSVESENVEVQRNRRIRSRQRRAVTCRAHRSCMRGSRGCGRAWLGGAAHRHTDGGNAGIVIGGAEQQRIHGRMQWVGTQRGGQRVGRWRACWRRPQCATSSKANESCGICEGKPRLDALMISRPATAHRPPYRTAHPQHHARTLHIAGHPAPAPIRTNNCMSPPQDHE